MCELMILRHEVVHMFENSYMSEQLGWQKLEDTLRQAEEQRRVIQAIGGGRPGLWRRLIALIPGIAGPSAARTTAAGRSTPDAPGTGEVPGL